jgi:hypothetical protein
VKVLSVRQPWAWALIHGAKDVENRTWPTKHRGLVAIHAGKQFDMGKRDWHNMSMGEFGEPWHTMARGYNQQRAHVLGAIIGLVELYDCVPSYECDSPWKAGDDPDYFCWLVRNPIALAEPIPLKGVLGLFDVADSLFPEVAR